MRVRSSSSKCRRLGVLLLVASAAGGHLVYPAVLCLLSVGRRCPPPEEPEEWPGVSVVISAYREERVIRSKVEQVSALRYDGALEVIVVADDEATATAARTTGATVLSAGRRVGKAAAVNCGVAAATHDVVVLTDANNTVSAGALPALVRHLQDPTIGAVAGVEVEDGAGERLYAWFESWLKHREHLLGTTIGIAGELVAIRRQAWVPLPLDVMVDDLWLALDLAERGHRIAYERSAVSTEPSVEGQDRWERRTRIIAGMLDVLGRKRAFLRRGGLVLVEVVGHKLWRSTLGPLSHLALLVVAVRHCGRSRLAALALAGHGAAAACAFLAHRGHRLPRLVALPAEVVYLQAVAIGGMVRALRRPATSAWPKPSR